MLEYLLGALLRILQALVSAGPTLLIGLLVAAIVQRLLDMLVHVPSLDMVPGGNYLKLG